MTYALRLSLCAINLCKSLHLVLRLPDLGVQTTCSILQRSVFAQQLATLVFPVLLHGSQLVVNSSKISAQLLTGLSGRRWRLWVQIQICWVNERAARRDSVRI
jgi:hypothetical protein